MSAKGKANEMRKNSWEWHRHFWSFVSVVGLKVFYFHTSAQLQHTVVCVHSVLAFLWRCHLQIEPHLHKTQWYFFPFSLRREHNFEWNQAIWWYPESRCGISTRFSIISSNKLKYHAFLIPDKIRNLLSKQRWNLTPSQIFTLFQSPVTPTF